MLVMSEQYAGKILSRITAKSGPEHILMLVKAETSTQQYVVWLGLIWNGQMIQHLGEPLLTKLLTVKCPIEIWPSDWGTVQTILEPRAQWLHTRKLKSSPSSFFKAGTSKRSLAYLDGTDLYLNRLTNMAISQRLTSIDAAISLAGQTTLVPFVRP